MKYGILYRDRDDTDTPFVLFVFCCAEHAEGFMEGVSYVNDSAMMGVRDMVAPRKSQLVALAKKWAKKYADEMDIEYVDPDVRDGDIARTEFDQQPPAQNFSFNV